MQKLNQLRFDVLFQDDIPKQEKPRAKTKPSKKNPRRTKKTEVDPLSTFLPALLPEEFNDLVCKSFKNKKDKDCRLFIAWDYDNDVKVIQNQLFTDVIKDLRSLEYIPESTLVEHLEWILDDPDDEFSFLSCLSARAEKQAYSELISVSLEKGISTKDIKNSLRKEYEIPKHDAYEYMHMFLEDQKGLLRFRISKKEKALKRLELIKNKDLRVRLTNLYTDHINQGLKNLKILSVCLETYFD